MDETEEKKSTGYGKRSIGQWIIIYLVIAAIVYGAFYYFVLAKRGGKNPYTSPTSTTTKQTPSKTPIPTYPEMKVTLASVNNSSQSGTATLTEDEGKTTVAIDLTGFIKDVSQPAHIHVGTCPGVGAIKYPLTPVVNGKSSTALSVKLDQLKKELPLVINVHKSKEEISVYTACGPLSAE